MPKEKAPKPPDREAPENVLKRSHPIFNSKRTSKLQELEEIQEDDNDEVILRHHSKPPVIVSYDSEKRSSKRSSSRNISRHSSNASKTGQDNPAFEGNLSRNNSISNSIASSRQPSVVIQERYCCRQNWTTCERTLSATTSILAVLVVVLIIVIVVIATKDEDPTKSLNLNELFN